VGSPVSRPAVNEAEKLIKRSGRTWWAKPAFTTDGGMVAPYEGAVQEAKLLRLEVGEVGWPLIEHA